MKMNRNDWNHLAEKLDWDFTYVSDREVYPEAMSGSPWLPRESWKGWNEPFQTTFSEYVQSQSRKDASVYAVREAVGRLEDFEKLDPGWLNGLKLHSAALPLAEFDAVVGNLR